MNRPFVIALAAAVGVAGLAQGAPSASAAGPQSSETAPRSLEAVRAHALAEMRAGNLLQVKKGRSRHWRGGGHRWGGRHHAFRRHWGGRRYHRGHRRWGYRRHHHGYGGAVAAGVAGLALGAIVAGSARSHRGYYPSKRWCARHYRSYDWRSSTYLGYDGDRHACP